MNQDYDEIEIDLVAVLWRMAAQWKLIVLMGLCCAVILCAASYVSDSRTYSQWQQGLVTDEADTAEAENDTEESETAENDALDSSNNSEENPDETSTETSTQSDKSDTSAQPAVPDLLEARNEAKEQIKKQEAEEAETTYEIEEYEEDESLTPDQEESAQKLLEKQQRYDTYAEYVNNSLLTGIDPYHKETFFIRYLITPVDDSIVDESSEALMSILRSQNTLEKIASMLDAGVSAENIREIYSVNYSSINSQLDRDDFRHEGLIQIATTVTDTIPGSKWENVIKQVVSDSTGKGSALASKISVEFFDERNELAADTELLTRQDNDRTKINDNKTEIITALQGFSDEQLDYYASLVADKNISDSYVKKETKRRQELAAKVALALDAAKKAAQTAQEASETALALTEYAQQTEEYAEISAAKAEEAAISAAKALENEKNAKAEQKTVEYEQSLAEAQDNADASDEAADEARKAAAKAMSAAEASQQAAADAESAVAESNTASKLREQAKKAAEDAAEIVQTIQNKAAEAQTAADSAQQAVQLAEAQGALDSANEAENAVEEAAAQIDEAAEELDIDTENSEPDDEEEEDEEGEDEAPDPPVISIKRLFLGGLIGIFVYGALLVVWIILRPRVCQETCSSLLSDRRTIRLRDLREPRTFKEQLFNDLYVYRWRNRNVPTLDRQLDNAVSCLDYFAVKSSKVRDGGAVILPFVYVGKLTDESVVLMDALCDRCKAAGIDIERIELDESDGTLYYRTIENLSEAYLVSEYDKTSVNKLYKMMKDLSTYDISLDGNIVLG